MDNKIIQDFFLGFIKIHILHHAAEGEIYGLWLIEELAHHGYRLSPGTLYPILHSLESRHYLQSSRRNVDGKIRKYYRITPEGERALAEAKEKVRQLIDEIIA